MTTEGLPYGPSPTDYSTSSQSGGRVNRVVTCAAVTDDDTGDFPHALGRMFIFCRTSSIGISIQAQ
jgi:hypothetical protein